MVLAPSTMILEMSVLRELSTKTLQEVQRGQDQSFTNDIHSLITACLDEPEVIKYRNAKPAPSTRTICSELGETKLYDQFRKYSHQLHAGLGMLVKGFAPIGNFGLTAN